jgi:hypothetical protein
MCTPNTLTLHPSKRGAKISMNENGPNANAIFIIEFSKFNENTPNPNAAGKDETDRKSKVPGR